MEERRLFLAVALSLLVLTAYRLYFAPPPPSPAPGGSTHPAAVPEPTPAVSPTASTVPPAPWAPAVVVPEAVPAVADTLERRVEVVGRDLEVAFTNRGARLISWKLLQFADRDGRPVEMVQTVTGPVRPLDIETPDSGLNARLQQALFLPSPQALQLSRGGDATLGFRYAEGDVEVEKSVRFPAEGYLVAVEARVRKAGQPVPVRLVWGPGLANATDEERAVQGYAPPQVVAMTTEGVERVEAAKIGASRAMPRVRWVGIETRYFAALLVPPGGGGDAEVRAVRLDQGPENREEPVPVAVAPVAPDEPTLLYVGPKDHDALARQGHGLSEVVRVGEWIGPIVVPLMKLLRWLNGHVGNYGWSIILLTVLINTVMAPLRHTSIANGLKMAKLAPEMRVIQERYRGIPALDKRREPMQREIASLYEKHGMSMGSQMIMGCLPTLLTLPFLFAIYRVLEVSIDLRGASFLWIPDLSHKDPLYITPVLMALSMFLMQKMMPTTMDPAQQRMMLIMPLVLGVMLFAAPAGLNLYWLASNLCSILQQGITMRIVRRGEAPAKPRRSR